MNKEVTYLPKEEILRSAEEFETPFFLYEEERLRKNCRTFRDTFRKYFPDFEPLFAVKANPNPTILKIIMDEDFGMDCSSEAEAWISQKIGATGMYTGNYTPARELAFAKDTGLILNLDDISMIPFLEEIGVPETISFRINPGVGKGGMESLIVAGPDAKYGLPFEKAAEAYQQAKDIGVKKFGIHMMTGSSVLDEDYFPSVVEKLLEIIAALPVEIDFMNIGGGFGVPYHPDEKTLDLDKVASGIRKVVDEQCEKHGIKEPVLSAEPGRFIAADMGYLVSKIQVIKDGYKKFLGIDASSNDMPRPSIYGAYHHVTILNDSNEKEVVSVTGSICENNDQFVKDIQLPTADIGDVVVIHNSGGHAHSMGHNYNGKVRHAEYLLSKNGEFKKIRNAETIEDLFKTVIY